jgi:hypothetical protein
MESHLGSIKRKAVEIDVHLRFFRLLGDNRLW